MDNYENIRAAANKATTTPPRSAWDKLEGKLDYQEKVKASKLRRTLLYLAGLAACCAFIWVSSYVYNESNKIPTSANGHIAQWEDLDAGDSGYYDTAKIHSLKLAYRVAIEGS